MRGFPLALTTGLLLFAMGCGAQSGRAPEGFVQTPTWAAWAQRCGGVCGDGPERIRAEAALARLAVPARWNVSVRVLSNENLGAWTFADGSVFVSRALVRVLNDNELCAVLAHETGHLTASNGETGASAASAFDGASGTPDCEAHADDHGIALLAHRGIAPGALASALLKVRAAAGVPPAVRAALDARIRRLTLVAR